ncbi:hypothetical protein MGYG_07714 [Nannizzia gypsea CBS 118893]|uniref:Uncharacterized protein n=1 Tax=Arthroderma gypseum (strain ATCC MYA-4604 / CBS 118893) TaxID=535722 RepID=E4V3Y2_ARTGP|nr:hypothetical protein MGYG_07714 [Nannizzia gypsea CBS 118893]EFR04706.1 hypothetical protein MGYG_07714 [Nannizzia gypsea CBS 118893]
MHDMREDIENHFQFVDEIWEDEFWFVQAWRVGGSLRRTADSRFMVPKDFEHYTYCYLTWSPRVDTRASSPLNIEASIMRLEDQEQQRKTGPSCWQRASYREAGFKRLTMNLPGPAGLGEDFPCILIGRTMLPA